MAGGGPDCNQPGAYVTTAAGGGRTSSTSFSTSGAGAGTCRRCLLSGFDRPAVLYRVERIDCRKGSSPRRSTSLPWVHWGVITANVLSFFAVAVAYLGVRRADKRARETHKQAIEADARAGRAVEAADRSANAADRSANAMERMAVVMEQRAIEDEHRAPVPEAAWRLEHHQGDTYLLSNAGRGTAYDVRVEPGDHLFYDGLPDGATVAPGGMAKFKAARSLATYDDTMTVTWANRPGGDRLTWKRPLPPRPTREHISSLSSGEQLREALRLSNSRLGGPQARPDE